MAGEVREEDRVDKSHENFRREYETVAAGWRFLISLRFILAGFSAALQTGLLTLFYNVFREKSQNLRLTHPIPSDIESLGMFIISLAGALIILGVMVIELRTIQVFRDLIERGVHLEYLLGMGYGHFCILRGATPDIKSIWKRIVTKIVRHTIRHTIGLFMVYIVILFIWLALLVFSCFQL